jgi:cyclohexanone monooxygenase
LTETESPVAEVQRHRARLEEKYREERAKRLRPEGLAQYVAVEGNFARFGDDPYGGEPALRPVETDQVDVVIVGAGISGLSAAVELRKAGVNNFRVIDHAADFGGTWYWNRYPGVRCDVEAYIYLPYLEETGHVPSEKYTPGSEIHEHLRSVARKFDLYENARFQTQVTEARWSPDDARWVVRTDRGDVIRSRFIVLSGGPLHRPRLPGIPGIDEFEGVQFHSSRWDYSYTGGDSSGGLTKLRDKRVAVIGTSSSGIQVIPHVARDAEHLYVVQRTPALVDKRNNAPTDRDWFVSQAPGWQRRRRHNFDGILAGLPQGEDLVSDQWTEIWGGGAEAMAAGSLQAAMAKMAEMDFEQLERIRARVGEEVHDPRVAAALKPYYSRFCKRPQFSDEYLPTFNRPNVTLIDTQGRGLDRITRTGLVFDGREYPVDLIVHATGFEFAVPATRSGGFEAYGPGGKTFSERRAQGVRSLHGIMFSGFPNLFVIGGLHQAAVSVNVPLVFGDQARHTALAVQDLLGKGARVAEVTAEAEDAWAEVIARRSMFDPEASRNCTPGAYNNDGISTDPGMPSVFATAFGGGPAEYAEMLEAWRHDLVEKDMALQLVQPDMIKEDAR